MTKEQIYKTINDANRFNSNFNITHSESYMKSVMLTAMIKACYPLAFINTQKNK